MTPLLFFYQAPCCLETVLFIIAWNQTSDVCTPVCYDGGYEGHHTYHQLLRLHPVVCVNMKNHLFVQCLSVVILITRGTIIITFFRVSPHYQEEAGQSLQYPLCSLLQGVSVKVTFSPSMSQGLNLIKYW